jgi:pimeloyl-ACP methyl ester carboxylesterase
MQRGQWLVLPVLALSWTVVRGDAPADVLDKAPSHFAKLDEMKVHYKSLGEGKTAVVFIHGWCCDLSVWQPQAAALHGKVRMLFVDLPGYGKSDKPKIDYTMDLFAKGVGAVLRDAGVDKAALVGHSMGTGVVRQYYRLFPDKTTGLIFVDGALRPFTEDQAAIDRFMSMFQEKTFKETAPKSLAAMFQASTPKAVRDHITRLVTDTDPRVAISSMRGMLEKKVWKPDPIKVPAQALMAKSPFWTDDYKKFVKKLVPDLDYREFNGVGHFLFMEKPKEINEALAEFLKKLGMMK